MRKMPAIAHLHGEEHGDHFVAVRTFHGYICDVGAGVGNLGREPSQQPALVGDQQPDAGLEHALNIGRPLDVNYLVAVDPAFFQRLALAGVD